MVVIEPVRQQSSFSRSLRRSLDVMGFSVLLRTPKESNLSFGSSNSHSTTSSLRSEFDPKVGDNSEAATDGSPRVKRDASGWRRLTMSLLRGSKTRLAKLRPEARTDPSNSESDSGNFNSSNSFSTASSSEADFVICQEISEDSINESSNVKTDASGRRGSTRSLPRGSSKLLAKLRTDGGMESPNAETNSKQRQQQEFASKVEVEEEDSLHGHEGGSKRNLQPTGVQDYEFANARGQLEGPEQPDGHGRGSNRAVKGYISIQKSINQLRKRKPDVYHRKVVVNGVPIKDVEVKKAEEMAGPIHPGNYWYDIQAGFWGVEPGPCLGIIPPCILQLNASMSRHCAGGNTGILVNGRELHEKDLARLSFRGLPTAPGMAYCISIDGRVMLESSRKYVTCLGQLAPSLGKSKRGSGIYIPAVY